MTLHLLLGRNMNIKFVTCFRAELRLCYCLRVRLLLHKVISYYCIRQTIGGLALLNTSVCMYEYKTGWYFHALQGRHNGCMDTVQMQICKH